MPGPLDPEFGKLRLSSADMSLDMIPEVVSSRIVVFRAVECSTCIETHVSFVRHKTALKIQKHFLVCLAQNMSKEKFLRPIVFLHVVSKQRLLVQKFLFIEEASSQ